MGCFGSREKGLPTHTQRWDFINLDDFRCTSAWTYFAYAWLWFMAFVSVAVYTVDTFTAVNLLAYNKWSSQVQPKLALKYSKWLFAACIILSWALAIYEWLRALRVIQRGGVAQSYMDPLAVTLQSMRSRGWKRFLVFTELTKSKKRTDYIALFVHFSFQGAIRVVLAEGPRQCVNALTLWAVCQAKLLKTANTEHHPAIEQFFINIGALADSNSEQAAIYFSMLFTLVIWVFSALSLITAAVLYLLFLWHYIPSQDGSLSAYCKRKIDKRLAKIVEHKVVAAVEEEQRQHQKAEQKAELKRQKTGEIPAMMNASRQPTLPELGKSPETADTEKLPTFPLARQGTGESVSTLPLYSSAPPSEHGSERAFREPTLPNMRRPVRPGMPSRAGTQSSEWSNSSYASDAPLLANTGFPGEGQQAPPLPGAPYNRQNSQGSFARPLPGRTFSQSTQASQRPYPPGPRTDGRNTPGPYNQGPPRFNTPGPRMGTPGPGRPFTPGSRDGPLPPPPQGLGRPYPPRTNTNGSFSRDLRAPQGPPARSNTNGFDFDQGPRTEAVGEYNNARAAEPQAATAHSMPTDDFVQPSQPPSRPGTADPYRALPPRTSKTSITSQSSQNGQGGSTPSAYTAYNAPKSYNRKPSVTSFNRPFTPVSGKDDPSSDHESIEMTTQPSAPSSSATGQYVAFKPSMPSASNTPAPLDGPHPSAPHVEEPSAEAHGANFLQVNAHSTSRIQSHASTYGGLLDEYDDAHDAS